jgi:biopolymer transport protein ExbD
MKKHLSKVFAGFLGVCVGFAVCYFSGVSPTPSQAVKTSAVAIARDGSLSLGGSHIELSQLSASLKKQATHGYTITIFADEKTDYSRVVEVVDACKAAGVSRIAMRTSATQ